MVHLGDITKISGYDAPAVDVVIGGSPCQDLSIAGKRAGLAGERSGLFMEQIRVIKELRERENRAGRTGQLIRPRFMVWENVPGALSSNKGEDFRAVLEETARVAKPDAVIPRYEGGWRTSGCIVGRGWSIAWRVLDAQFWGVPQRRRRIALVADFGGHAAPEILFVRKGVCGDIAPGGAPGEGPAAGTGTGACAASAYGETGVGYWQPGIQTIRAEGENRPSRPSNVIVAGFQPQAGGNTGTTYTVDASPALVKSQQAAVLCAGFKAGQGSKASGIGYEAERSPSLVAASSGTNQVPVVYDARGNGGGGIAPTMTGDHENRVTDYTALVMATGQSGAEIAENMSPTLNCDHEAPILAPGGGPGLNGEITGTLVASYYKGTGAVHGEEREVVYESQRVRRLTPLECERLQGFPDGWTDIGTWTDAKGKSHETSDAARYKALGNSIAIPPWAWVLKRLCACYERPATMASLFDGIGGFPLIWERLNGPGSCIWASEIEEFPIAVTKRRFGG